MTEKLNPYLQGIDILHTLAHANLNPNANGGIEAQKDQLYGLAGDIFKLLAHTTVDARFNGFMDLLRRAREEADHASEL